MKCSRPTPNSQHLIMLVTPKEKILKNQKKTKPLELYNYKWWYAAYHSLLQWSGIQCQWECCFYASTCQAVLFKVKNNRIFRTHKEERKRPEKGQCLQEQDTRACSIEAVAEFWWINAKKRIPNTNLYLCTDGAWRQITLVAFNTGVSKDVFLPFLPLSLKNA